MAEKQGPNEVVSAADPPKVEVKVVDAEKKSAPAPKTDDLSVLTPQILEALCFDSTGKTAEELKAHNTSLQALLGKIIELLKEKSSLCSNLEKQTQALMLQTNSLKDVVGITKDLLGIRNMEVDHLQKDMKSMEEKINKERERHNNMLNRMSEAVKLNENLKQEYQKQLDLFTNLRARYEEKITLLENENKRLSSLVGPSAPANQQPAESQGEGQGEGGVQLSLEKISP